MKKIPTVEGKFYCVATSTSCDVTTEAGTLLGTAEAGQPLWFQAQKGDTTTLSDDNAEYSASRFNSAPQQQLTVIGVLGGGNLPSGYTRLDYLESTGSQYMVTDFIPTNESGICLDSQMIVNRDVIPCGCRNSTPENTRFFGIRSPLLASSGQYLAGYGWGAWVTITAPEGYYRDKTYLNWRNNRLAQCKAGNRSLEKLSFTPIYPAYIFAANVKSVPSLFFIGKIWRVAFSQQTCIVHDYVPAIMPDGTPCMYDTVERKPLVNSGGGEFICGVETLSQLDAMLRRLPDRTGLAVGTLQVRLAADLQTPVNEARLDAMLAKNWEISQAA